MSDKTPDPKELLARPVCEDGHDTKEGVCEDCGAVDDRTVHAAKRMRIGIHESNGHKTPAFILEADDGSCLAWAFGDLSATAAAVDALIRVAGDCYAEQLSLFSVSEIAEALAPKSEGEVH